MPNLSDFDFQSAKFQIGQKVQVQYIDGSGMRLVDAWITGVNLVVKIDGFEWWYYLWFNYAYAFGISEIDLVKAINLEVQLGG